VSCRFSTMSVVVLKVAASELLSIERHEHAASIPSLWPGEGENLPTYRQRRNDTRGSALPHLATWMIWTSNSKDCLCKRVECTYVDVRGAHSFPVKPLSSAPNDS
jgi:hypothetical protein